jgi:acetyl-CoA carboxylase biotin carboxyl carrier protein
VSDLESVLATLHRTASAMAADPHPPARIRLGASGVTLEWDLAPATAPAALSAELPGGLTAPARNGVAPVAVVPAVPAVPTVSTASAAALPVPAAPGATAVVAPAHHTLTAPTVGVFYRSAEPGKAPFVDTGDLVAPGQQVGIVEAMKLMIPVEADRGGRVAEVLCADATAVEFGAPLFALAALSTEPAE